MVGLAFELHDTAAARHNLQLASDNTVQGLALRIKYQQVDPSFVDILMYSFCYIGLLTGKYTLTRLSWIMCLMWLSVWCSFLFHILKLNKQPVNLKLCNCVPFISKLLVTSISNRFFSLRIWLCEVWVVYDRSVLQVPYLLWYDTQWACSLCTDVVANADTSQVCAVHCCRLSTGVTLLQHSRQSHWRLILESLSAQCCQVVVQCA